MTAEETHDVSELKQELEQELLTILNPSTSEEKEEMSDTNHSSSGNCELCQFASFSLINLTKHYNKVHSLHYCVICKKTCSSKFHLDAHLKATHPSLFLSGTEPLSKSISELRDKLGYSFTADPKPGYICNYCDKKVRKKTHIITHIRIHTGEQPFKCPDCDYKSAYMQSVRMHRDKVHLKLPPKRPYSCSKCDKTFRSKCNLSNHEHTHVQFKKFSCDKCDFKTSKEVSLREHRLDKHSNFSEEVLKPHSCDECGFRFKTSSHLDRHMKVHKKDVIKPYLFECQHCDSTFTERYNLRVHIETQHEQKPFRFVCNVCNKGFHGKTDLQNHSVIHQKDPVIHQCAMCDFQSKHVKSVQRHYKAKHGDGPLPKKFVCEICSKSFEIASKLKRHMYVHDYSLKPIACNKCNYRCEAKGEMRKHLKTHGHEDEDTSEKTA